MRQTWHLSVGPESHRAHRPRACEAAHSKPGRGDERAVKVQPFIVVAPGEADAAGSVEREGGGQGGIRAVGHLLVVEVAVVVAINIHGTGAVGEHFRPVQQSIAVCVRDKRIAARSDFGGVVQPVPVRINREHIGPVGEVFRSVGERISISVRHVRVRAQLVFKLITQPVAVGISGTGLRADAAKGGRFIGIRQSIAVRIRHDVLKGQPLPDGIAVPAIEAPANVTHAHIQDTIACCDGAGIDHAGGRGVGRQVTRRSAGRDPEGSELIHGDGPLDFYIPPAVITRVIAIHE